MCFSFTTLSKFFGEQRKARQYCFVPNIYIILTPLLCLYLKKLDVQLKTDDLFALNHHWHDSLHVVNLDMNAINDMRYLIAFLVLLTYVGTLSNQSL